MLPLGYRHHPQLLRCYPIFDHVSSGKVGKGVNKTRPSIGDEELCLPSCGGSFTLAPQAPPRATIESSKANHIMSHPGDHRHGGIYYYLATCRTTSPVLQVISYVWQTKAGGYLLWHHRVTHIVCHYAINFFNS